MLEIHTPESWYSVFKSPSIVVDDEGLIYNGDDYRCRSLTKNPIGKIDYSSGYIFGGDFRSMTRTPIGMVKQKDDAAEVFGQDFRSMTAIPVFYIRGDKVFTYEEYHRWFSSTASYHIKSDRVKSDCAGNNSSGTNSAGSGPTGAPGGFQHTGPSMIDAISKLVKPVLIILAAAALSAGAFANFTQDEIYAPVLFVSLGIGFVSTFILVKKNDLFMNVLYTELMSVLIFWVSIMAIDIPDSEGFALFGTIFLAPFLIALVMAVPSVIAGIIAYGIRKLIKK